jgi:nitrous oxidase accessory protein NosD
MRTARLAKLTLGIACSITLLLKGELMPMPEQPPREWRVPEDFPTIQAAIDAAQEGDTILIAPGVYREHLVISKSLILQGAGPDTVLEGEPSEFEPFQEEEPGASQPSNRILVRPLIYLAYPPGTPISSRKIGQPAIVVQVGQVQIRSLQIRPQGWQAALEQLEGIPSLPNPLRAGVVIERGAEAFIEHVIIRHSHYGVVVRRGASLTLRHSILHDWRIGLQIWGTATVEDSSIHNEDIYEYESSEKAILVEQSGRAFLYRNRISIFHVSPYQISAHRLGDFNDGGISFYGKEITVEGNQIVGDLNYGIYISEGQASIRDNLIIHRGGSGLDIRSAKATVEGNIVIGMMPHGVGIQINPRAQATVRHNKISQNSIGIEVVGATAQLVENEVYANKNGIQLTHHWQGDGQVELVRNKVSQNEECGISAHRYVEGKKVYEIFAGQLTGEGNEVQGNLQADLCPADYPWPPGFKK